MPPIRLTDFANDLYLVLDTLYTHQIEVGGESYVPLSQQEIAALVGCSRPKINHLMKGLTDSGYIASYQKKRGKYMLTDAGLTVVHLFHGESLNIFGETHLQSGINTSRAKWNNFDKEDNDMATYDHRTVGEQQVSYYVFNDLRYQQNGRHTFDIYRFDTLSEAMDQFRQLPADMTPALGMHRNGHSELDLLHRREGEVVLVTDYLNFPSWRTDPSVVQAVDTLCSAFGVEWQMNSKCLGTTVLIPLERGFERIPNRAFADKNLLTAKPSFYDQKPSAYSAINEGYVEGEGWLNYAALRQKAEKFGFHDPHCVKVRQFNIQYVDDHGHAGQADISPLDLEIMLDRHTLRYGEPAAVKTVIDRLADEISELLLVPGPDQSAYAETLRQDLSQGQLASAKEALVTLRDYGDSDHQIALAERLLTRLTGIAEKEPAVLPDLCYTVLESTGELICIKKGEEGYFRTDYSTDDPARNQELADHLNHKLGITSAQVSAMSFGSMFGWNTPGADPTKYVRQSLDHQITDAALRKSASAPPSELREQDHTH